MPRFLYRVELVEHRLDNQPMNTLDYGEGDYLLITTEKSSGEVMTCRPVKVSLDLRETDIRSSFGVRK